MYMNVHICRRYTHPYVEKVENLKFATTCNMNVYTYLICVLEMNYVLPATCAPGGVEQFRIQLSNTLDTHTSYYIQCLYMCVCVVYLCVPAHTLAGQRRTGKNDSIIFSSFQ